MSKLLPTVVEYLIIYTVCYLKVDPTSLRIFQPPVTLQKFLATTVLCLWQTSMSVRWHCWQLACCTFRAVHNFFHVGGNVISQSREHGCPAAVHCRGSGGMLACEILVILGVLRSILVHSEAYREAHRASWEEAHHQNHHCLLSYWNTGNHLHQLGSTTYAYT